MYIIDKRGKKIVVEDLEATLQQVEMFKRFYHETPGFDILDEKLREYWTDLHEKLTAIKNQSGNTLKS
ncbi:hypothetical protein OOZ15_13690 [Galbibacter sp. EGI 63066]|uniref:hypothetical protein n=1 Tax=Galbibacter sp. EGI 63066 TaxID=2993559 RepID=UPI0022494FC2|nr:hypothetical protein [Galbibacter sp. EGI 63066]MCX2681001.1 hypothetical protein [Galbibacter sp. EGI 63066]